MKQYLDSGDTSAARINLLKLIAYDSLQLNSSEAYRTLGDIELQRKNFPKALLYYDYSVSLEKNISKRNVVLIKKTLIYLSLDEISLASSTANMIEATKEDTCLYKFKILTKGLELLINEDLASAKSVYLQLANNGSDSAAVISIFNNVSKIHKKSLRKARLLSTLMPGLGQYYLGDVKNGTNSLLLVGSLTFLVVNTAIVYNPLSSFLIVFPWWFRYYVGGIKSNDRIYNDRVKKDRQQIYTTLLDYYFNKNTFCKYY